MQANQKIRASRRLALLPVCAMLAALASGGARADEPSPWYIGVSQGFTHDSNVYRIANATSDNYSTTSLLGGLDQPIGRQRLRATAQVGYNRYQDQRTLDNTSYGVSAGWDWATVEKLTGSINASANQRLAQFNGNQGFLPGTSPTTTERNILKTEQLSADVRWGGDGLISVFGNYGHSRVRYSALQSLTSESTTDSGSVGLNYRLGASTTVGAAVRLTRSDYPYGIPPAVPIPIPTPINPADYRSDTSDGKNLDLLADWRYSAQTGVNARLSWTRVTYANSNRDFSGLTGSIAATYAPTAKLTFNGSLDRNAGTNSSSSSYLNFVNGQQTSYVFENTQSTDTLSLGVAYAATAKITANANVLYRRSNFADSSVSDQFRSASLGATYAIARSWQLACSLAHESRAATGNSYDANVASCSAQFTLR